jgi:hypothetical protein
MVSPELTLRASGAVGHEIAVVREEYPPPACLVIRVLVALDAEKPVRRLRFSHPSLLQWWPPGVGD